MTNDQNQTPSQGSEQAPPPPPEQPYPVHSQLPANPNPQQPGRDWQSDFHTLQNKYNGLSGHASAQKTRADKASGELTTISSEFEAYKLDTDAKLKTLDTSLTESRALAEQQKTELDTLKRTQEVGTLVHTEFPSLVGLFEKQLIRGLGGLEGDDLKAYLTEFQTEMGIVSTDKKQREGSGSTPPPPGQRDSNAMTLKDAQDALQAATDKYQYGSADYTQAQATYMEALKSIKG